MSVTYGLINKSQNKIFVMDRLNHNSFWSTYLRSKFPNDEWLLVNDSEDSDIDWDDYERVDLLDVGYSEESNNTIIEIANAELKSKPPTS